MTNFLRRRDRNTPVLHDVDVLDEVLARTDQIIRNQHDLTKRLIRIETRLCRLAISLGHEDALGDTAHDR